MTKTSRLGETLVRSNPQNPRLDEKSRSTCATPSLRRTSLAWARVYVAQNPSTSLERDARMAIGCATLLISPRRAKLAWARIADSFTDHALDSLQLCSIRTPQHTKHSSIIPNQFTQFTTSHWHSIDSRKSPNSKFPPHSRIHHV